MVKKKTVVVDFDGVLHWYREGWGDGTIYDEPVPGAAEAMKRIQEMGYCVVVCSSRATERTVNGKFQYSQAKEIIAWLDKHKIPYNSLADEKEGKPMAVAYIDDRAVRFEGDWTEALANIAKKPWNFKWPISAPTDPSIAPHEV